MRRTRRTLRTEQRSAPRGVRMAAVLRRPRWTRCAGITGSCATTANGPTLRTRRRSRANTLIHCTKRYAPSLTQFAIANLKHYRTRGIALRWRTEDEVVDGIGQFTCANQRCEWHVEPTIRTKLETYEVPFAYEEPGEDGAPARKQALVKVRCCPLTRPAGLVRCVCSQAAYVHAARQCRGRYTPVAHIALAARIAPAERLARAAPYLVFP